eukprot:641236-Amphidinium_carterae.2
MTVLVRSLQGTSRSCQCYVGTQQTKRVELESPRKIQTKLRNVPGTNSEKVNAYTLFLASQNKCTIVNTYPGLKHWPFGLERLGLGGLTTHAKNNNE